jgi:surfeit locus 1 family protein
MKWPHRRGRFWPTVATIVGVAVALALGNWQLDRGAQKRELKAHFDAQAAQPPIHVGAQELSADGMDMRHVEARGVFEPRYAVFIDNRIHRGVPGYHVVMPLKLEGADRYVLVNRGWIARPALRSELPAVRTPPTTVTIEGMAVIPGRRILELSKAVVEGPIWQNLTIPRYRDAMPLKIQPFVIRQESTLDDGLVRAWDPPDFGIEKHYGYAFQWFALAATLLGFYAVTQFGSRFRRKDRPAR